MSNTISVKTKVRMNHQVPHYKSETYIMKRKTFEFLIDTKVQDAYTAILEWQ